MTGGFLPVSYNSSFLNTMWGSKAFISKVFPTTAAEAENVKAG